MLTVGVVSGKNLGYYQALTETGQEHYYERGATEPGRWWGKGAEQLGLAGDVRTSDFRNVLHGYSPSGDLALVQNAGRANGERARRPGFDFTFSAPKDFSVLHAATTSPEERVRLGSLHDEAVSSVLEWLEQDICKTRIGKAGRELVDGKGLVVARFRHHESRELDPQVHTHCLIANLAQGPDDRWRSLATRHLFTKGLMKRYGTLYREVLASALEREFGLEVRLFNGYLRVEGVPLEVSAYYSKRRAQILEVGYDTAKQAGKVALETRRPKRRELSLDQLSSSWREELASAFGSHFTVETLVKRSRTREASPVLHLPAPEIAPAAAPHPRPIRDHAPAPAHEEIRSRPAARSLRARMQAALPERPSRLISWLETGRRRLSDKERDHLLRVTATTGEKQVEVLTHRGLRALSAAYAKSGFQLLAVTRSTADAKLLTRATGVRSIAGLGLLKILDPQLPDWIRYNLSLRGFAGALRRDGPLSPLRLVNRRFGEHSLNRRTVILLDQRVLSPDQLALLRMHAEVAGTRLLLAPKIPISEMLGTGRAPGPIVQPRQAFYPVPDQQIDR
jgi:conjugative relaxase-like TrwC/TraI family protein